MSADTVTITLGTRHPDPATQTREDYGRWVALGGMVAEYLAEHPTLSADDIRVLAAHFNVSPFAVLDMLDRRGIAHEPDPILVPEGSDPR